MTHARRLAAAATWLAIATGCGGDGCSCMEPIPGGFPSEERIPNAVQVRITPTGLAAIEDDPAALVSGLLDEGMGLTFDIPPACGDGDNPAICCEPVDGPVVDPCGPIAIDLEQRDGDAPRLEITPVAGANRLDIAVRARVKTVSDLAIWYDTGLFTVDCGVEIDTEAGGSNPDLLVTTNIDFVQDATAGTTRLVVGDVNIDQLDGGDISLNGGFDCTIADLLIGFFTDTLIGGIGDTIQQQIEDAVCKQCPGGTADECGEFADACQGGVCMKGGECLQEVGMSGRMLASSLLASLSPGQPGAVDIYLVAGGYATTEADGLSLGMLGGAVGGDETARCGPIAERPADIDVPLTAYFQGNTRPDTGDAFGFGVGIHQHELDRFAWAAYDGGLLCLDIGASTVDLLNSDTLSILMPSLTDLLHGTTSPLVLGLRPQQPPTMLLGAGTFTEGGDIDEPLLDVAFQNLEIDFFAMIDDQYVRVMTMHTDVALPIGLDVTPDGELQPIIGATDDAFTNISVSNSKALLETPEELADRLPAVLSVALPFLGDALSPIALPELGGLTLAVQPGGITTIEDQTFLAIFADLALSGAMAGPRVDTRAELVAVHMPEREAFLAPRLDRAKRPVVELALDGALDDGAAAGPLEFSVRVDGGMWSPYKRDRRIYLERDAFWLVGEHTVEVRAREVGRPLSADRTPVVLRALIDTVPSLLPERPGTPNEDVRATVGFHGRVPDAEGGCSCGVSGARGARGSVALWLLVAAALWTGRRRRRRPSWLSLVAVALAFAAPAGCNCGSDSGGNPCGPIECLEGEVEHGPTGRFNSMAADGERFVITAYDEGLGDLVLLEVAADDTWVETPIDGVPDDTTPVYAPDSYRGGIAEPGANVGTWTSAALRDGLVHVAYHDVDNGALKYARETADGWQIHVVDADGPAGLYASLAFDGDGAPAIAYLATGLDDGVNGKKSQLRFARASSAAPAGAGDWTVATVDEAAIPCTGLCGDDRACVAASSQCAAITADCAGDCGSGTECIAGACTEVLERSTHDIPEGTGLFADLAFLADGSAVIVYYDRSSSDLVLQQLQGGSWTRAELDAAADTDTGMWAATAVSGGTVHVVYQDALRDRLLYTSWTAGTVGPVEVVDDGARAGDRRHHVGAGAALILDDGGLPVALYQDAEDGSLRVARRDAAGAWSHSELAAGPSILGFFNGLAKVGGTLRAATYVYDRVVYPPGQLELLSLP